MLVPCDFLLVPCDLPNFAFLEYEIPLERGGLLITGKYWGREHVFSLSKELKCKNNMKFWLKS